MVLLNELEVIKEGNGLFIIKLLRWVEGWVENKVIKNFYPDGYQAINRDSECTGG